MLAPLAASAPNPVVWVVVGVLVAVMVGAGLVMRRTSAAQATASLAPRTPEPWDTDDTVWGLLQPPEPVQRMARGMAAGFASIDPEEESKVVYSLDGGATWHVLPEQHWFS